MRSYRKAWRSPDFKTLKLSPDPTDLTIRLPLGGSGAGRSEPPWQKVAVEHQRGQNICSIYNRLAAPANWYGYDGDGNLVDFASGLDLANRVYNVVDYSEHPLD